MDAESQLLADKDAEIARLKNQPVLIFEALYAEIERLKALTTELCDAMERQMIYPKLVQTRQGGHQMNPLPMLTFLFIYVVIPIAVWRILRWRGKDDQRRACRKSNA